MAESTSRREYLRARHFDDDIMPLPKLASSCQLVKGNAAIIMWGDDPLLLNIVH